MKRAALICLIVTFVICLNCAARSKGIQLVYKYTAGEVDKYKTVGKMSMSDIVAKSGAASPSSSFKTTKLLKQKVLGVLPDGSAKIYVSYKKSSISTSTGVQGPKVVNEPEKASTIRRECHNDNDNLLS